MAAHRTLHDGCALPDGGEPISDARICAKIETLAETLNKRESLEKVGYLHRHALDGGPPVDMTPIYGD